MSIKFSVLVLAFFFSPKLLAQITIGQWSTACIQGRLNKAQFYQENGRINLIESYHQDVSCLDKSFRFETRGRIYYYTQQPLFIDFVYQEIYLTLYKQIAVDDFNARKVCGYNNWQAHLPQNILGLSCALFEINKEIQVPKFGDLKYGIFKIENGKLYYGQLSRNFDGSTFSKRPKQLNWFIEYIFQN